MRIVLCDDHAMWLEALATALATRGHSVVATAMSPAEAVDAVADTDPDVCALDVNFPEGNGLDAAEMIRRSSPRTRVLMLTGASQPALVSAALRAGASGLTRKDQSVDAIMHAVERVAAGATVFETQGKWPEPRRPWGPGSEAARAVEGLTTRERDVLRCLVDGRTTGEIARELGVTKNTARTHVQNILIKLGAHSRLQAASQIVHAGLVDQL